jgi:CDP-diacylglycerol--glycerol-3-phosphate 3-phosphatidyltransferase
LVIALVGTGLQGFGAPHAITIALGALAVLSLITLAQRL